jgi:hypothetical protein
MVCSEPALLPSRPSSSRALRDDDVEQFFQLQAVARVDLRRIDALKAQQPIHQVRLGMLVRDVEGELLWAHGDVAGHLQCGNRLANALCAAEQDQLGSAQTAADQSVQRIEACRLRREI